MSSRPAAPPPIGRLVDIGGYRLHLACQGKGSPTVVMEAAIGETGLLWSLVQPAVAQTTRACVYDRAGLGWSDPSPSPRTAAVMVEELHTLLATAEVPGPYVLVGHSFGGLLVRLHAARYPQEVAGWSWSTPPTNTSTGGPPARSGSSCRRSRSRHASSSKASRS